MTRALRSRGLTLVEVVVALAVMSLIVLALGASLRGLSQSAQRLDTRIDATDEMRVSIAFLRDSLARTLRLRAAGTERQWLFDASSQSVAWVAVMPARFGAAGRFAFRLALEASPDGQQQLVLRYAPLANTSLAFPDWALADARVLARGVRHWSIGYGGEGLVGGWQPTWTDNQRLPPRLRFDLDTDTVAWPPVVLPIRVPAAPAGGFVIGGGGA